MSGITFAYQIFAQLIAKEKSLDWCINKNSGNTASMYDSRSLLKFLLSPATQDHKNTTIVLIIEKLVERINLQRSYFSFAPRRMLELTVCVSRQNS